MKLIITRPDEDAGPLAEKLSSLGHEPLFVPLIDIVPRVAPDIPALPYQAICFTSANGPRAVAARKEWDAIPVFTVGPQSRDQAHRQGYQRVSAHGGDVIGLCQYLRSQLKPQTGPILYLSGAETSGDLEGKLKSRGFTITRVIVYDATPLIPANLEAMVMQAGGVLLYSPRTAQLWVKALVAGNVSSAGARLMHYCLSANVAANLPGSFSKRTARTPDEGGMLSMLDPASEQE